METPYSSEAMYQMAHVLSVLSRVQVRDNKRGLDWRFDLLLTLTHASYTQVIKAPSLISTLYSPLLQAH
jgi:hypothetical protein